MPDLEGVAGLEAFAADLAAHPPVVRRLTGEMQRLLRVASMPCVVMRRCKYNGVAELWEGVVPRGERWRLAEPNPFSEATVFALWGEGYLRKDGEFYVIREVARGYGLDMRQVTGRSQAEAFIEARCLAYPRFRITAARIAKAVEEALR